MNLGKIIYGAFFAAVLPCLLILWAVGAQFNVSLPVYGTSPIALAITACGLGLMLAGMWQLWHLGGGLPMNAYPPPRLVSSGTFYWLPHPIYSSFAAMCFGVAMTARSASGLWLVAPSALLGCTALVLGYERPDLKRRFGDTLHVLPADDAAPPSEPERWRFFLVVVIPWIALYEFTTKMGLHGAAFRLGFEDHLPIYPWTSIFYQSTYLTVAVAPWCARSRRDLRRLMVSAWVAMAVIFPTYWIIPSSAPRRPLTDNSWLAHLLTTERNTYPPTAAFPSFHVLWAIFIGRLYRPRWIGAAYAASIVITCITTGMHYIPDVIASLVIAPLLLQPERAWNWLLHQTEGIANSWREWRIGPVRIIHHGLYAAAAAFVQCAVVASALGRGQAWKVLVIAAAGLLGAGAWAHWIEGSSVLRRPFGFYGGMIAVGLACLFFEERWILLAANCLGAPWMQTIGRVRCLVNGCCHGTPAPPEAGIRVTHPRSRVLRLAGLAGVPVHPTQLYSILSNTLLGLVLLRLWLSGCSMPVICGVYAIGNGMARFVEEAYRGEPQTPHLWGLRLYQWTAVASIIAGAFVTTLRWPGELALTPSVPGMLYALAFAALAGAAMGLDFPESNRPLARLA